MSSIISTTWSVAFGEHVRRPDPESVRVAEDLLRVLGRDLERLEPFVLDREQHLVDGLGRGLVGHVTDVGDVHHQRDPVALQLEGAAEQIPEHVRAEVPEMRGAVHGGTAGVDLDVSRLNRDDLLHGPRERVVEPHRPRIPGAPDPPTERRGEAVPAARVGAVAVDSAPLPDVSDAKTSTGGGGTGTGIWASTPACSLCARKTAAW